MESTVKYERFLETSQRDSDGERSGCFARFKKRWKRRGIHSSIANMDNAAICLMSKRNELLRRASQEENKAKLQLKAARADGASSRTQRTSKKQAVRHLRRAKALEQRAEAMGDARNNILLLKDTLETAQDNIKIHNAMKQGSAAVDHLLDLLPLEKMEQMMDRILEQRDETREINAALSNPLDGPADGADVLMEEEIARLEQELDLDSAALELKKMGSPKEELVAVPIVHPVISTPQRVLEYA